jgi:polyhydroxyalkanoate synthesis repressor PhaR
LGFLFAQTQHRLLCTATSLKGTPVADTNKPLLIKRYASRRLYNTETSDYVTLEDIAFFIREGREVQIVDLKSGDDLTRQYLLQIIAEHESRGESVLPVDVLTDLVRSYTSQAASVVPEFLQASFEMLRDGQSKALENMGKANPMATMPGFDAMRAQQAAFFKAMTSGIVPVASAEKAEAGDDLGEIKNQLAALQEKLSKMGK